MSRQLASSAKRSLEAGKPILAVLFSILVIAVACAEPVPVPGTSVSMSPPDGFVLSESFSGFQRQEDGSSIMIAELPIEGYAEISELFTGADAAQQGFASQGVRISERKTVAVEGLEVPVLIGEQDSSAGTVAKYVALARGDAVIMVTANIFDTDQIDEATVLAAFESIRISSGPTTDSKIDQLPFSFDVSGPFKVFEVLAGSSVVLNTDGRTDPTGLKPFVMIARALDTREPSMIKAVSMQALRSLHGFEDVQITSKKKVEFAGGAGYYLAGVAGDRSIVQYLRIPADGVYVRLVAIGSHKELSSVFGTVEEIAQSVAID